MRIGTRTRCNRAAMLALAAGFTSQVALGQQLTWDASGNSPTAATDGSGTWSTTAANWTDGASNFPWIDGDFANIGNGGNAGIITIDSPAGTVQASGIQFNPVAAGAYTIAANGSNTLTLVSGASLNFAAGVSATISAPIAGSVGMNVGGGSLTLAGNNVFSGPIQISGGTVTVAAGSNLGNSSNSVSLGVPNNGVSTGDATGALVIADGVTTTIGSFRASANNNAAVSTLSIGNGSTLNINNNSPLSGLNGTLNAAFVLGTSNLTLPITTKLIVNPGAAQPMGALNVNAGTSSFVVGVGSTNTSTDKGMTVLDMSNLSSFTFVGGTSAQPGGEFAIGHGSGLTTTVTFAATSTVTAGLLTIGDHGLTPGLGAATPGSNAPASDTTLLLGSGLNTLNVDNINIGFTRNQGVLQWAAATTTGSLVVNGTGGVNSTTNLTVGSYTANFSPPSSGSSVDLTKHTVSFKGGTVILGELAADTRNNSKTGGALSFDTGNFSVVDLIMGKNIQIGGVGSSTTPINGTLSIGSGGSTGVFTVTNSFLLASNLNPATGTSSVGSFGMKGGTADIRTNIIDVSTGASTTTVVLSGGTLNMNGFAIGPKVAAGNTGTVGTKNLTSISFSGTNGILANLGGTGINDAGLNLVSTTANSATVLTLEGSNGYSGGTNIAIGTLQVGQNTDIAPISTPLGSAGVTDAANLNFGSGNAITVPNTISGGGTVNQTGTGSTTLVANNTYTGVTSVNNGKLRVLNITNEGAGGGTASPIGASSNAATNLVLSGGTLQYAGSGSTTDRLFSVTPTGGSIDSSGSGALVFSNTGAIISADAAQRTSAAITSGGFKLNFSNVADLVNGMTVTGANVPAGTTIVSINPNANSITVNNSLGFIGAYTVSFSPADRTLALTGTNTGANTIAGALSNTAAGATLNVTKSGTGAWTLSGSNSYSGVTTVQAGTLTAVGSAAWAPALANSNIAGGRLVFDYSSDTSPASTVRSALMSSYASGFATGPLRSTSATANKGLGWKDDAGSKKVTVMLTYFGDADLDGQVTTSDFTTLGQNFGSTTAVWAQGDFNYDGVVNAMDFNAISTNFGSPALGAPSLGALVPEPASMGLLIASSLLVRRRRR